MLNSKEQISLKLRPEIEAELNNRQQMVIEQSLPSNGDQITIEPEDRSVAHVDGNSLYEQNESKGWFREGKHGREVLVDDIKVEPVRNEQGDYHRMKLFSHIFKEVDMKTILGEGKNIGAQIGGALLAGLAVMSELGRDRPAPAVFVEHHHDHAHRPYVYFKGSVDSPQDLASRAFDAGLNAGEHGVGLGHGR